MREKVIREYIRKIISNKLSENKELKQEGIVSGVLDHISGILKKANDKRFQKSLEKLAKTPDGKKKVDDFVNYSNKIEKATSDAEDLIAKYGL